MPAAASEIPVPPVGKSGKNANAAAYRDILQDDARHLAAFVERWRPKVATVTHARHRTMLGVVLGESVIGLDKRTALYWAIGGAVFSALAIGAFRLARKQPVRHAINGLFGIAVGAFLAWRTGNAEDFYLPGILLTFGQAAVLLLSVVVRKPLIGYAWGIMANKGHQDWHGNVRELENVMNRLVVVASTSIITRTDVENVLGVHLAPASVIAQTYSNPQEASRVLRPNTAELCEDETITAYMRRVKLDVLTAAITQYPSRTAAAERLGLTKDALKRQLRYLRNATARSTTISTNDQEEL